MANCPYVDQEESGPSNGWYCSIVERSVDYGFYSNYCCSAVSCEHCPYRGGDDRLRNPECLTEEVCSSIIWSVKEALGYLDRYICETLARIIETATGTGYEHLGQMICQYGNYYISFPDLSGTIEPLVLTDPERDRARSLEQNLTQEFQQIQPGKYLSFSGCRGLPDLSSRVFGTLADDALVYGYQANCSVSGADIDAGSTTKYEEPVRNALILLGNEVERFFGSVSYGINKAGSKFESGCSRALSGIGNSSGYTGDSVIWHR